MNKQFKEIGPETIPSNPLTAIGKQWMLVTAGSDKCNTMTASWGGVGVLWTKNVVFVVVRPQRYTREFMDQETCFSLSFLGEEYRKSLSYLGSVSGRDENKIATSGLTVVRDNGIPYFEEAQLVLLCRKMFRQQFQPDSFLDVEIREKMYPEKDFHYLYVAEITKALMR